MPEEKLRVLDVPWHLGHQYEMLKFPWVKWSWLCQYKRQYSDMPRGNLESMFEWVPSYEKGKYDLAILHLDQNCIDPGVLDRGKGSVYTQMNDAIRDIPKIVIMHGTPFAPETWPNKQDIIDEVKRLVGDNYMIVNSHTAAKQWGWGKAIIHGMDPNEWYDLPKEPRVVTMISPAGMPAYYDRSLLEQVRNALAEHDIQHCHITVDYSANNWTEYREFLGRSLLYFNPTRESPMPRSRTEAMLSGCCVITTPYQDADTFIVDGYNGFIIERNPTKIAELIEKLLDRPDIAQKVGQQGKKTAQELFSWERYEKDWKEYMQYVIDDYSSKHPEYVKPTMR